MSDTSQREPREPAERPFPYVPYAVLVTVAERDRTVADAIAEMDRWHAAWGWTS